MALPDNLADLFINKADAPAQPESLRKLGYTITKRLTDLDGLPPAARARVIALLGMMARNPKPAIANDWKSLIREHPDVPGLKRQLALAYAMTDREALAEATIDELVTQHPTYLSGVIRRASYFIFEDQLDEAEALLGGPPVSLQQLAPDQPSFAVREVGEFAQMASLYEMTKGNAEAAEEHLRVMRDLGTHDIKSLRLFKETLDNTRMMDRGGLFDDTISISGTFRAEDRQTDEAPTFIHPEMQWLYEHDLSLPADKRDALLALPRPSLTADLSTVLLDLVLRFDYLASLAWDATTQSFGYHALLLATELRATECLDAVLETLRQGDEVTDFWFNDWREDYYTPYFRRILPDCADEFLAFMCEPDINTFNKSIVSSAYAQEAALHPDHRPETIRWYETVLTFFLENADDPDQLDMDLNGLIISDLLDMEAAELLPRIRDLYNRNLVNDGMAGTLVDVEKQILTSSEPHWQLKIKPIGEQYTYLHDPDAYYAAHPRPAPTETDKETFAQLEADEEATMARNSEWDFLYEEDETETDDNDDDDKYEPQQPRRVVAEPGRNDKVSVRYLDGKVVSDVKYKKVEPDVKAGKCTFL